DMDGADGRPISHHTEIADKVFDRVGGKQRHPVVGADVTLVQKGGDAADRLPQLTIGHGPPALREYDPGLPWVASGGPVDPVSQLRRCGLHGKPSGQLLSNISNLVAAQARGSNLQLRKPVQRSELSLVR